MLCSTKEFKQTEWTKLQIDNFILTRIGQVLGERFLNRHLKCKFNLILGVFDKGTAMKLHTGTHFYWLTSKIRFDWSKDQNCQNASSGKVRSHCSIVKVINQIERTHKPGPTSAITNCDWFKPSRLNI